VKRLLKLKGVAKTAWLLVCLIASLAFVTTQAQGTSPTTPSPSQPLHRDDPSAAAPMAKAFVALLVGNRDEVADALKTIERQWTEALIPFALETMYMSRRAATTASLARLLHARTGQSFGHKVPSWQRWMWAQELPQHQDYAEFKARLYEIVDPKFAAYFSPSRAASIRLDEIVWGGVRQDGIPPLRTPRMMPAAQADYLDDDDVIFGLSVNGDTRAYPKRILGWHEMFIDDIGGTPVAGVYCTLCGTVIIYRTQANGVKHALGTSGFLYRSNKLMYDRATQSLWSTMRGVPVVGPLMGQARLERLSVVTSSWGEWRRRHPESLVLHLATGYQRDYREGAAYRSYFASDDLMFQVPGYDPRLRNKDEVLALHSPDLGSAPLAIAAAFLARTPVHHVALGRNTSIVILTDKSGANRAYAANSSTIVSWDQRDVAMDDIGEAWQVSEAALTHADGRTWHRYPAHRAFWFGWHAAFPNTTLVLGAD
jgi:hypothetical protein